MKFGDILKPVIEINGEMVGFKVREDMMTALYLNGKENIKILSRVVKISLFMNRMMQFGRDHEFQVIEKAEGLELG